jgi:hypothetical protein
MKFIYSKGSQGKSDYFVFWYFYTPLQLQASDNWKEGTTLLSDFISNKRKRI